MKVELVIGAFALAVVTLTGGVLIAGLVLVATGAACLADEEVRTRKVGWAKGAAVYFMFIAIAFAVFGGWQRCPGEFSVVC